MPTNNFKLFDQNKANLLSDTEYANATQRLNGVQTGVASSQLNNKFAYQVSLVAYAIAQIMNQNGLDATDTLSVSAFVGNLGGSLLQKVADKASTAEAVAGVIANKYISPATMKAAALLLSGGVMNGTINMNNNQIINLPTPTSNSEPATKEYVDGRGFYYKKNLLANLTFTKPNQTIDVNISNNDGKFNNFNGFYIEQTFNGTFGELYLKAWAEGNGNSEYIVFVKNPRPLSNNDTFSNIKANILVPCGSYINNKSVVPYVSSNGDVYFNSTNSNYIVKFTGTTHFLLQGEIFSGSIIYKIYCY